MQSAPFFSVVVATRNRAQTLGVTLRAIAEQTTRDFEVLVVDDGSTTETRAANRALVAELGTQFRLVELGPDGHPGSGPSQARNRGIAEARGRFLAFCDDDDQWCAPDHLATAADALRAHPNAAMYFANQAAMRDGVEERGDWLPELTAAAGREGVQKVPQERLIQSASWPHLNILIVRRDLAVNAGGFWEETRFEEDMDFYWRCLDRAAFAVFNPQVVARHNIPDASQQANVSSALRDRERLILRAAVTQHVRDTVSTPLLQDRALRLRAETLRSISLSFSSEGRRADALRFARDALAARFTWKWALYVAALRLRAALPSTISR